MTYSLINKRESAAFSSGDLWGINGELGLKFSTISFDLILDTAISQTDLGGCKVNNNKLIEMNGEKTGRLWRYTTDNLFNCNDNTKDGRLLVGFLTKFDSSGTDNRVLFVIYDADYGYSGHLVIP